MKSLFAAKQEKEKDITSNQTNVLRGINNTEDPK